MPRQRVGLVRLQREGSMDRRKAASTQVLADRCPAGVAEDLRRG